MMGRTPCCDKTGVKKGAWTPEEDQKLTAYIQRYGVWNWRELPKYAGLSRCGKSCRLRWMNYLRPDIKRGNYTTEEEKLIMELHESLGNRWSAIASKLPGRTDNEIKNHWHTYIKKRLKQNSAAKAAKLESHETSQSEEDKKIEPATRACKNIESSPLPQQPSSSEFSSVNSESAVQSDTSPMEDDSASPKTIAETKGEFWTEQDPAGHTLEDDNLSSKTIAEPLGNFWTEPYLAGNFYIQEDFPPTLLDPISLFPLSPISLYEPFASYGTCWNDSVECFDQLTVLDTQNLFSPW